MRWIISFSFFFFVTSRVSSFVPRKDLFSKKLILFLETRGRLVFWNKICSEQIVILLIILYIVFIDLIVQKSVSFFHDFIINISAFQIVQSRFKIFTLNSLRKFRVALFFERISKRSLFFLKGKSFWKNLYFSEIETSIFLFFFYQTMYRRIGNI